MPVTTVYVKTPKGIDEISNRTCGLPPRARQLLVLLDGKRNGGDIALMLPDGEGEALLASLVADGFVAPLQEASTEASAADSVTTSERPHNDAERFQMAKNFMRNTVHTFLGGMGSGFISQVDKCASIDELRQHFESWQEALLLSGDGRKQLVDLERRLAALLS